MRHPPGNDSARAGTVPLASLDLHYVECGSGPNVVVLLHGYTDSWRSFRLILPLLAPACRCLAVDLRGHGGSSYEGGDFTPDDFAGDVIEFLDRSGIESATLIGHSMGSFIARRVALERPDLVERLILVGSGLHADNPVVRDLAAQVETLRTAAPRPFVEEFQGSCVFDRASLPALFFDECVAASMGVPSRVWKGALAGLIADDDRGRLAGIPHPTLVVAGREDSVFDASEQEQLARALPRSRLRMYERCGHSPHWERPEPFSEDVLRFLGETG